MKTVIVDIGHADGTGARGFEGLEEHSVNVVIGDRLVTLLKKAGLNVVRLDFPHETNTSDLNKTVAAANKVEAALGISLHSDWAGNANAHGGHAEHMLGSIKGKKAAQCIAAHIVKILPGRAEPVVSRPNATDKKTLAVLRGTRAPWVLVEGGFITNPCDANIMRSNPQSIAEAYCAGILDYLNSQS